MSATETSAQFISDAPNPGAEAFAQPSQLGPVGEDAGRAAVPKEAVSEQQRRFRQMGLRVTMVAGEVAIRHLGVPPEGVGRAVDIAHDLASDPDFYKGVGAMGRFTANSVLAAAGLVPGVGEIVTVGAEAALAAAGGNLTPEVPSSHRVAGHLASIAAGGIVLPFSAVEQAAHDWPDFVGGLEAIGEAIHDFRKPKKKSDYALAA